MVREMSWMKGEPDWMLDFRMKSLRNFERRPMPSWGADLSGVHFDDIFYYIKPTNSQVDRSEEHTSELQSLMRISYAVFCLKQKNTQINRKMHESHATSK